MIMNFYSIFEDAKEEIDLNSDQYLDRLVNPSGQGGAERPRWGNGGRTQVHYRGNQMII